MKKIILIFLFIFSMGSIFLFSWEDRKDLSIVKAFGFSQSGQIRSPATILKLEDSFSIQDFYGKGDLLFKKLGFSSSFSSFPQEEDSYIFFFDNFLRKELYISNDSFNNFSDFKAKTDDLVYFYLYDSQEKRWVNPFFVKPLLRSLSVEVKDFFIEVNGKKFPLRGRTVSLKEKDDFTLIIGAESFLLEPKEGVNLGLYELILRINGIEVLDFKAQAISSEGSVLKWVGLDTEVASLEEGIFRIFSPSLKNGLNEIEVEVGNFLYGSLKLRGYIRVLPTLIK